MPSPTDIAAALRRSPAVHFAALGLLAFLISRTWWGPNGREARISVGAAEVARLERRWISEHGSTPSAAELDALVEHAVDERILQREAESLGLGRDRLVRDRLDKLARYLELGNGFDEARDLGLEREDPVVRRYLAHLTEIALAGPPEPPSEAEVRERYERLAAEPSPTRFRIVQIYLGRDLRGSALAADADDLLRRLRQAGSGPEVAGQLGDPFGVSARIGPATPAQLARTFGPQLAAAVERAPAGIWLEPLPSSWGLHLVWIEERLPGRAPDLGSVRNRIVHDLVRERQELRQREGMRALRARYDVRIER